MSLSVFICKKISLFRTRISLPMNPLPLICNILRSTIWRISYTVAFVDSGTDYEERTISEIGMNFISLTYAWQENIIPLPLFFVEEKNLGECISISIPGTSAHIRQPPNVISTSNFAFREKLKTTTENNLRTTLQNKSHSCDENFFFREEFSLAICSSFSSTTRVSRLLPLLSVTHIIFSLFANFSHTPSQTHVIVEFLDGRTRIRFCSRCRQAFASSACSVRSCFWAGRWLNSNKTVEPL